MKRLFCLPLLALLMTLTAFSTSTAHADIYQRVSFAQGGANSNGYNIYGIDDFGDFVTYSDRCPVGFALCYNVFVDGQQVITGDTSIPTLVYDNGTSCGTGYQGTELLCINGREAFVLPGQEPENLYVGSSLNITLIKSGVFGFIQPALNRNGDIVFDDGDNFEEYIDVTSRLNVTPEPSSILLMGTGILGFANLVRRRYLKA